MRLLFQSKDLELSFSFEPFFFGSRLVLFDKYFVGGKKEKNFFKDGRECFRNEKGKKKVRKLGEILAELLILAITA